MEKANLDVFSKGTEEEFNNFLHRVTQVEKIVQKLSSDEISEQQQGKLLADELLKEKTSVDENEELKVTSSRTVINKILEKDERSPDEMSRDMFMKSIEEDVKRRTEDRKIRNERAETYKKIGNNAFKQDNYEKAITYFGKAIEQRKDSSLLWNNRALSYMKLKLYENALSDFEWALKVDESNLKALLNSAKCYKLLENEDKCQDYLRLAREKNASYVSYIEEYEEKLYANSDQFTT